MSTLAQHLTTNKVQPQVVIAVARNLSLARTNFPSDQEMLQRLRAEVPRPEEVSLDVAELEKDATRQLQIALDILSLEWDRDQIAVIEQLRETQESLRTLPWVAVPAALLLGAWIYVTGGVTHSTKRTVYKSDGTYEQVVTQDRAPFRVEFKSFGTSLSIGPQSEPQKAEPEEAKPEAGPTPEEKGQKTEPQKPGSIEQQPNQQRNKHHPSKTRAKGKVTAPAKSTTACTPAPTHGKRPSGRKR